MSKFIDADKLLERLGAEAEERRGENDDVVAGINIAMAIIRQELGDTGERNS